MELVTWTLIIATFAWIYYYLKKRLNFFEDRGVPYAPAWPVLGNMAGPLLRTKHVNELVVELYNTNPDAKYIGAFDFMRPVVVLRDPELIKSVTIKNFDNFPDHQGFIDVKLDPIFGGNLFNMQGDQWKEARSLLSPAFTSSKMKAMYELMVECGENFVNFVAEQPDDANKMVATKDLFTKYTNDVIATCAFGISVNSLKDPKNDFYVLGTRATSFDGLMTLKFFLARMMPKVMQMLNIKFLEERIGQFFKDIVAMTVATRDEKGITRPDMLQLMMDARGKESKNLKLDITEMTAQAFIFFFGGFDSTSTEMCIMAHELALNPDVQKRLQDEIDDVLRENKGKPTYEAINGMLYLDAVFNETMRYHTLAGFLDRVCKSSFELPPALPGAKPFTVQEGMNVWIPAAAIHKDPKYHENPDVFDPDRYYQKKVTINDVTNLAFGIGPRSCIGNRFAILETKILIFHLLSKFNLKPNAKTCNPLKYSKKTFTIKPDGGFRLELERRS